MEYDVKQLPASLCGTLHDFQLQASPSQQDNSEQLHPWIGYCEPRLAAGPPLAAGLVEQAIEWHSGR